MATKIGGARRALPRNGRQQNSDSSTTTTAETKLDAVLQAQKQTNELLTLLVQACVRTVQIPAGATPPANAVRIGEGTGPTPPAPPSSPVTSPKRSSSTPSWTVVPSEEPPSANQESTTPQNS